MMLKTTTVMASWIWHIP